MPDLSISRTNAAWRRSLFIMAMTTLGACGDTTAARVPSTVAIASGNTQSVVTNAVASSPLVVTVLDQDGAALSGVTVVWSINSGTGSLSAESTTTDSNGQASVQFTAGADAGDVQIDAIVSGLSAVSFDVTVTTTEAVATTDGG